ncbi:lysophospholipid acyltransferase family protein [Novosphingobium lentum]|uniref:lysophospholipid acyltransferase family protein n=1 Tax=Novosphingobium lentum TaxID=145287 RepID=UPI001FE19CBD|nr:lysophospholipid acyltransferase family protein [Novosphingobium lentum]
MIAASSPDDGAALSLGDRLRIVARLNAMLLALLVSLPLYYLWRIVRLPNPWPRRFLGAIAWIVGARVRVDGAPLRRGAFLLANHVSWMDIPIIAGATGTAFVAHDGLAESALLKWLCEMNDTVFIARNDRAGVHDQVALVRAALSETGALAIFPEGTTSDGTGLLPFKSSLLSALDPAPPGIMVQPVVLDYGAGAPRIAWVGEEHGLHNFLRILAQRDRVAVTLHVLEPFEPGAAGSRKAIAALAQRLMAERLSPPASAPAR